jgi:Flp pilus assembly protein TadD
VGEAAERLVPELAALVEEATPTSDEWRFAHRNLALLLATTNAWLASSHARAVLTWDARDHAAWAALALAQSLLGHHRYALRCYERALAIAPDQPRYAHNLGHLYDVVLNRPERALPLLERAYRHEPGCPHVASSLAHALGRLGRAEEALALVEPLPTSGRTRDQHELLAWLRSLIVLCEASDPAVPPGVSDEAPLASAAPTDDSAPR